jgi:hypothetical protein
MLLDIDHMCDGSGRLLALEDPSLSGDRVLRGQTPDQYIYAAIVQTLSVCKSKLTFASLHRRQPCLSGKTGD